MKKIIALIMLLSLLLSGCTPSVVNGGAVKAEKEIELTLDQTLETLEYSVSPEWVRKEAKDGFYYYPNDSSVLYVSYDTAGYEPAEGENEAMGAFIHMCNSIEDNSDDFKLVTEDEELKISEHYALRKKYTTTIDSKKCTVIGYYILADDNFYSLVMSQEGTMEKEMIDTIGAIVDSVTLLAPIDPLLQIEKTGKHITSKKMEENMYSDIYVMIEGVAEVIGAQSLTVCEKDSEGTFYACDYYIDTPSGIKTGDGIRIYGYIDTFNMFTFIDIKEIPPSFELTEMEDWYKNKCASYTFEEIARNPNDYIGKYAMFTGEVIQVLEQDEETVMRVNITNTDYGYTDTIYVTYKSKDGSRILENDIIVIYGELQGLTTYENVLGTDVTIPMQEARYIALIK